MTKRNWLSLALPFGFAALVSAQIDPRNAMLERSAWDALTAGRAHAAAEAFREAIDLQFRDITRAPGWAAGAYDGTIRVPMRGALENQKELDRVLSHEFVHALVRSLASRGVPTWLNEGLATALETGSLDWAGKRIQQSGGPAPLRTLQSGFGRLGRDQAQLAYATSALTARRLLEEAGGFAIANLLRDLGDGVDFETAFLDRIQRSFTDFQATPF